MPSAYPPAPPVAPPQASSSCRYKNARDSELEQLRQRGLAKLLNKHFTAVTQSIAEERAAADAALRDLEARKAAGLKDWSDTNADSGELSAYDKLYLELQQKKDECRRKEKETVLLYQRYVAKFGDTGVVQAPHRHQPQNGSLLPPSTPRAITDSPRGSRVPFLAGQIETNLSKHVSSGAERHPSINSLGKERTYQQVFSNMDDKQRVAYLRTLEGRGVDVQASTPTVAGLDCKATSSAPSGARVGIASPDTPQGWSSSSLNKWVSNDTPVSHLTATTAGTESPLVSPLQAEGSFDFDDDEVKSSISELTSAHSLIFSDAEVRLVEFLKTETAAIKQMLEGEQESTVGSVKSSFSSEVGSTSARAADQAEDMVYQMQQILRNHQDGHTDEAPPTPSQEPRPYDTGNPSEQWSVHFDETYQREYYHERISKRTQWTPPPTDDETSVKVSDYTSPRAARAAAPLSHLEVMPEQTTLFGSRMSSRRDVYRQKRRKRRKQRRVVLAFLALLFVGGSYYVTQKYPVAIVHTMESALSYAGVPEETTASILDLAKSYLPEFDSDDTARGKPQEKDEEPKSDRASTSNKEKAERNAREEYEHIAREIVRAQEEARMEAERKEAERVAFEMKSRTSRRVKGMLEVMLQAPRPV